MTLTEENKLLRDALEAATEKLQIYRSKTNGEYVGGMEYGELMKSIARAVLKQPITVQNDHDQ